MLIIGNTVACLAFLLILRYFCFSNGYQLFIKENANAELPFGEINRQWKKQLSQEERNSYTTRAKLARDAYNKNLAEFEKVSTLREANQKHS